MKFLLFVEDRAERKAIADYVRRWLNARLQNNVGVAPVMFNGKSDYRLKIKKKVDLYFAGAKSGEIIAAIGLVDLHTLCDDLPQLVGLPTPQAQCKVAKNYFEQRVDDPRFRQHFAVHEIEAWLLASPQIFPQDIQGQIRSKASDPEAIGSNDPPAKLIARLYWEGLRRKYNKANDGSQLLRTADPNDAYQRCPQFRAMLDDMLDLAKAAGA